VAAAVTLVAALAAGAFLGLGARSFALEPPLRVAGDALEVVASAPLDLGEADAPGVAGAVAQARLVAHLLEGARQELAQAPVPASYLEELAGERVWFALDGTPQAQAAARVAERLGAGLPGLRLVREWVSRDGGSTPEGRHYLYRVPQRDVDAWLKRFARVERAQGVLVGNAFPSRRNGFRTGVVVLGGDAEAPAQGGVLALGDVVQAVEGIPVKGLTHFKLLLENTVRSVNQDGGGAVLLLVARGDAAPAVDTRLIVAGPDGGAAPGATP
jgi:hypothetical protein